MKKADTLTGKISMQAANPRPDDRTVARAEGPEVAGKPSAASQRDHVDAINQVFAELELAYHNQYHKAYAQEGSLPLAKKYWLECLAHFSPAIILKATRAVVTSQQYLPSVATIIQASEEAMSSAGLPPAHDAYVEACCAEHPKASQQWSHPAVYLAGKQTGWFELANRMEAQIYPLFQDHYRKLCQRVLHGETLKIEIPQALPEHSSSQLSPEENKDRMAKLRKQLKTS